VFVETLSKYTFTLCVNGGGLDPSPKAFEAIIAGSIPIIKYSSGIYSAYKDLPVVTSEKLEKWLHSVRPFYEDIKLRREILYKLTYEYWNSYIRSYIY
jgi:hypothetical protein